MAPAGSEGMPGVIVPRKTVGEIQRLLEDPETDVAVELSEAKIRVTVGDVVLTSKLIDGTFPDYGRVIPQGNDKELKVDRAEFAEAVDPCCPWNEAAVVLTGPPAPRWTASVVVASEKPTWS